MPRVPTLDTGDQIFDKFMPERLSEDGLSDTYAARTDRTQHVPAFGLYFPEAEGAIADGNEANAATDRAALNAAIAACVAGGGGQVHYDGNLVVDQQINVPQQVTLVASRRGYWDNYATFFAGSLITLKSSSGLASGAAVINFHYTGANADRRHLGGAIDVVINGNGATNVGVSGFKFSGVRFVNMDRCYAMRTGLHGFSSVTEVTAVSELYLTNCFAGWNTLDGYRLFGGDSTIKGAMAGWNGQDGAYLGLASSDVEVFAWNNERFGTTIAATAATNFLRARLHCYDSGGAGVNVESGIGVGNVIEVVSHGNGRDKVNWPSATDRVGIRINGAPTPTNLTIESAVTGNRDGVEWIDPDTSAGYQMYGISCKNASATPGIGTITDAGNVTNLWFFSDATNIPESKGGRFTPFRDNLFAIGRSSLRWLNVISLRHEVLAAANDTQPRVRMGSTVGAAAIDFGAGGSTATDVGFVRGSIGVVELSDGTTGGGGGAIRLGNSTGRAARLWSGSGAPSTPGPAGISYALGDAYFRTDTPTTANQRLYLVTTAGTSPTWTGVL